MHLTAEHLSVSRGKWTLTANGVFNTGVHLVTGPVGSGKTTLASALAGILKPASGRIIRDGRTHLTLSMQFPEYHVTGFLVKDENPFLASSGKRDSLKGRTCWQAKYKDTHSVPG